MGILRGARAGTEFLTSESETSQFRPGVANGSSASPILVDQNPQYLGDDIGDNTSSTTSIAVGGTVSSSIQHGGDLDYFRVNLVAGQAYTFSVAGLSDAYVELRDSTGALVAQNDDGGINLNAFLMTRAPTTGQYFVVARGYDASSTGAYTLSVNAIATGNTSPTQFTPNSLPIFSWEEAAIQITRSGHSWSTAFDTPTVVTYAYRSTAPGTMPDDTGSFSRFSAAQIAATELALAAWSAVANITFQRVDNGQGFADSAAILFANYGTGAADAAAFAYLPSSANRDAASEQGDVWINNTLSYNANPVIGEYGSQVLLHEIGHALGLRHPADYNAEEGVDITYGADATYYQDSRMFTSMSYFGSSSTGGTLGAYASLPQLHDIAAIQRLYGANTTTRTGNTVYGFNSNTNVAAYTIGVGQTAVFSIWDGGGNDTLDLSGYSTNSVIDLRQEAYSSAGPTPDGPSAVFNISIARGAIIENAIGGSGNDTITGNAGVNVLIGNAGNDTLNGLDGNDVLEGGEGNDLLIGGLGNDRLEGGLGVDTASFSGARATYTLIAYSGALSVLNAAEQERDTLNSVENLQFSDGSVTSASVSEFQALDYIASHDDLISFGANADRGYSHYILFGFFEGRAADTFDGYQYTASYDDLIIHLGNSQQAAVNHFISSGYAEGRSRDDFDAMSYLASYDDVLSVFGNDQSAAARHFIEVGYAEGRARDAFDGLAYIAGYDDLVLAFRNNEAAGTAHFVNNGYDEGRDRHAFDAYQYIASHADLIMAFGRNAAAATQHYLLYGFDEERERDTFDAEQYLANYQDLQAAFGSNLFAATLHYITYGFSEGRTDDPFI